jgi:hypothetical protein
MSYRAYCGVDFHGRLSLGITGLNVGAWVAGHMLGVV